MPSPTRSWLKWLLLPVLWCSQLRNYSVWNWSDTPLPKWSERCRSCHCFQWKVCSVCPCPRLTERRLIGHFWKDLWGKVSVFQHCVWTFKLCVFCDLNFALNLTPNFLIYIFVMFPLAAFPHLYSKCSIYKYASFPAA